MCVRSTVRVHVGVRTCVCVCVCVCVCAEQKDTAASLCSITTEVLKVLNATQELIGEAGSGSATPSESMSAHESSISSSCETRRLDQRLTKMEENVRRHVALDSYLHTYSA